MHFVPTSPINNKSSLVLVNSLAWNMLPEPMLTQDFWLHMVSLGHTGLTLAMLGLKYSRQTWLTHYGLMTPYGTWNYINIGSGNGLLLMAPSHYLNQCWLIVSKVKKMLGYIMILRSYSVFTMPLHLTIIIMLIRQMTRDLEKSLNDGCIHFVQIMPRMESILLIIFLAIYGTVFLSWSVYALSHIIRDKNGCHFADNIFKHIFLNDYVRITIQISPKFVSECSNDNNPALVYMIAWHRPGDKPLSEPMLTRLTDKFVCGTRGKWVNDGSDQIGGIMVLAYCCHIFHEIVVSLYSAHLLIWIPE